MLLSSCGPDAHIPFWVNYKSISFQYRVKQLNEMLLISRT